MTIRSFVLRQGRMTDGQNRAFNDHWSEYGIDIEDESHIVDLPALFPKAKRFILEIGFGNGESLLQMAEASPESAFVGIEVHGPGVGHALLEAHRKGLKNLRFIRGDAVEILRGHIADNSLDRVQIYFPDPWQKMRHHKRRLIQAPFLALLHEKLHLGGELHLATDWEDYAKWMHERLFAHPAWQNIGDADGYSARPPWRPETKFEKRGIGKGHGVWDLRYQSRQYAV